MEKPDYFIRCDGEPHEVEEFYKYFENKANAAIAYFHVQGVNGQTKKTHFHATLIGIKMSKNTFYDHVKKLAHISHGTSYYCKKLKSWGGSIHYMSRGFTLQPTWNKHHDEQTMNEFKQMFATNTNTLVSTYIEKPVKVPQITMAQMEKDISTQYIETYRDFDTVGVVYHNLYKITREVMKRNKKGGYDLMVQRLMEGAGALINDTDQWDRLKKRFLFT